MQGACQPSWLFRSLTLSLLILLSVLHTGDHKLYTILPYLGLEDTLCPYCTWLYCAIHCLKLTDIVIKKDTLSAGILALNCCGLSNNGGLCWLMAKSLFVLVTQSILGRDWLYQSRWGSWICKHRCRLDWGPLQIDSKEINWYDVVSRASFHLLLVYLEDSRV